MTGARSRGATGRRARRLLSPVTDRISGYVLRRADTTRAVSAFTSGLIEEVRGEPATATFPTYSDLSAFVAEPGRSRCRSDPSRVFVGMLEAVQEHRRARRAWRRVARDAAGRAARDRRQGQPAARRRRSAARPSGQVEHHARLSPAEVAATLDGATLLVLPSWPEGLGRVVIEAFARGRGVVATAAGGVLDLVDDGVEGILIPPADTDALVRRADPRPLRPRPGRAARRGCTRALRRLALDGRGRSRNSMRDLVDLTLARSRADARAPRLRHPGRRRRSPCSRPDDRHGRGARAPLRRGRRPLRPRRSPRAARQRPAPTFGSASRVGRGARLRAAARRRARAVADRRPDAVLAHMVPDVPHARRAAVQAAADPARPLVHALERRPVAPPGDAPRGRRPQRRPAVVPARRARRCGASATRSTSAGSRRRPGRSDTTGRCGSSRSAA